MATDHQISLPTVEAIESAQCHVDKIQRIFPEAVADFEAKWEALEEACESNITSTSNLDFCIILDEFEVLLRLGPKILIFVILKLIKDAKKNWYGVFLFYSLEKDSTYCGNLAAEPLTSEKAIQYHSSQIIQLNCERTKIYDEYVRLWKEYCEQHKLYASSAVCCAGDEYLDLVEMGPIFIPHLMVEYANDRGGFWYDLLHEIIHGRKMDAVEIYGRSGLFDICREFLIAGDYDQAPKYTPTEWDIYIRTGKMGPQVW